MLFFPDPLFKMAIWYFDGSVRVGRQNRIEKNLESFTPFFNNFGSLKGVYVWLLCKGDSYEHLAYDVTDWQSPTQVFGPRT